MIDAAEVNFDSKNKRMAHPGAHFEVRHLRYLGKSDMGLKSDGEITVGFPIFGRGRKDIATEVHRDAGEITNKV